MVFLSGRGLCMPEDIQNVIDKLESLQFDILCRMKRGCDAGSRAALEDYDRCLDDAIEELYDFGINKA